jgi:hypothetical protein
LLLYFLPVFEKNKWISGSFLRKNIYLERLTELKEDPYLLAFIGHVKKTKKKSFFFNIKSPYSHTGLLEGSLLREYQGILVIND